MTTIWNTLGQMMVLVGDLLALVAAGAGLLALLGEQRHWSRPMMRQIWSNGIFGLLLGGIGLLAKLTAAGMKAEANGYIFALGNGVVAGLLVLGLLSMAGAYLLRRSRPHELE